MRIYSASRSDVTVCTFLQKTACDAFERLDFFQTKIKFGLVSYEIGTNNGQYHFVAAAVQ